MNISAGKKVSLGGMGLFLFEAILELVFWLISFSQMKDDIALRWELSNFPFYIPTEVRIAVLGIAFLVIALGLILDGISTKSVWNFVFGIIISITALVGMFQPNMFTSLYFCSYSYESLETVFAVASFAFIGLAVACNFLKPFRWQFVLSFVAVCMWILVGGILRDSIFGLMCQIYNDFYETNYMFGNAQTSMAILLSSIIIACLMIYIIIFVSRPAMTVSEIQETDENAKRNKRVECQEPRKTENFSQFGQAQNGVAVSKNDFEEKRSKNEKKVAHRDNISASDLLNDFLNTSNEPVVPTAKPASASVTAKKVPDIKNEQRSNVVNDVWASFGGVEDTASQKTEAPAADKKLASNDVDDIWASFGGVEDTAPQKTEASAADKKSTSKGADDIWASFGSTEINAGNTSKDASIDTEEPIAAESMANMDSHDSKEHICGNKINENSLNEVLLSENKNVIFGCGSLKFVSDETTDQYFGTLTVIKKDGAIVSKGFASMFDDPTFENMLAFIPGIVTGIESIVNKHTSALNMISETIAQISTGKEDAVIFIAGKMFKVKDITRDDLKTLDSQQATMNIMYNNLFNVYNEIASFVNEKCNSVLFEIK